MKRIEMILIFFVIFNSDSLNISPQLDKLLNLLNYVIILFLILLFNRAGKIAYVAGRDIFLLVLVFLSFASFFWSENPSETLTQLRSVVRTTLFGYYLASKFSSKQQINILANVLLTTLTISFIVCIAVPSYGITVTNHISTWQGIYAHKQYLGRAATVAFMTFLIQYNFPSRPAVKYRAIFGLLITLIICIMTTSRTSMALFTACLAMFPLLKIAKQKFKVREIILIATLALIGSALAILIFNLEFIVVDLMGKNLEFNGRTPLWQAGIAAGLERPWFGYGYAGFFSSPVASEITSTLWEGQDFIGHSHSGYIDTFLALGFTGLFFLGASLMLNLFRILRELLVLKTPEGLWKFQFFIIMLIYNGFELNTFVANSVIWIYYISITLSTSLEYSRYEKRKGVELEQKGLQLAAFQK